MSAPSLDPLANFARLWIDSSIQMVRATTELWSFLLDEAPAHRGSSTASPWWIQPQRSPSAPTAATPWSSAFGVGAWSPSWPQAALLPAMPAQAASPLFAWPTSLPTTSSSNPFAIWQQMWLQAAALSVNWPFQVAEAPAPRNVWEPFAAAYRTANGHAMAAVLRTMADAVEPKRRPSVAAHYWPGTLATRH